MERKRTSSTSSSIQASPMSYASYDGLEEPLAFNLDESPQFDLIDLLDFNNYVNLSDMKRRGSEFKRKIGSKTPKIDKELERFKARFSRHVDKAKTKWNSKNVVRTRDKIAFVLGVFNIFVSALLIGMAPEWIHVFYSAQLAYFMPMRYISYHRKGMHYFMADLCYWVNWLLVAFLWVAPGSTGLLISTYCLTHGSLAWAIVAWRNSLVFHSMDKICSLFIHVYPPLVLHTIVHVLPRSYVNTRFPAVPAVQTLNFFNAMVVASIAYMTWQVLYYVFIQVRKQAKIKAGRPTSFTWLLKSYSKTWIGRMVLKLPEALQPFAFMMIQYAYALVTMVPCPFWYANRTYAAGFLILVFGWSVWNGANYYIEVFGSRFQKELERLQAEVAEWERNPGTAPVTPAVEKSGMDFSGGAISDGLSKLTALGTGDVGGGKAE